jgi:hypothetical protein
MSDLSFLLRILLPSLLCVLIPRAIKTWAVRTGHKFSASWEVILTFLLLWSYLIFLHFAHKFPK